MPKETPQLTNLEISHLDILLPRARKVLEMRFGVCCSRRTLREVADRFLVSPERIRQIEKKALKTIRRAILNG